MRPKPTVSIITPVFNRVESIGDTVTSVSLQTYGDVEHIVVDGASTDGTVEVLERLGGRLGVKWTSEPDEGMYDAINRGLELATGSVIAYLNSDDLYFPWSVQAAVAALEGPSDMVFGDLAVMSKSVDSGPTGLTLQFYKDWHTGFYTHFSCPAQPTFFWKREVYERIGGFSRDFRLIADCDYWLRAAEAGCKIEHLREVLAIQTEHPGTLRNQHAERLATEFRMLRGRHGSGSPGIASRAWWGAHRRFMWRQRMVQFWLGGKSSGRGWPEFHRFAAEIGAATSGRNVLESFLPQRLRSAGLTVVDPVRLYDSLVKPAS